MNAMLTGPYVRKRKTEKQYKQYLVTKKPGCDFCAFTSDSAQVVKQYKHFWIVKNIFPYDHWDGMSVIEHLLIVPKRHVDTLSHFTDAESKEYLLLLSSYESNGYSVYARAAQNVAKSVAHQHTHLIKMDGKRTKAMLYMRKPHMVVYL